MEFSQLLINAAKLGLSSDVHTYLASGVNVNCQDNYGRTPLYMASSSGHTEVVKLLLLEHKADPNIHDRWFETGYTPLHVAGNEVIAECLINSGADINRLNNYGRTPLHEASSNGHTEVVKVLLKHNANPNICDLEYGCTPLHDAANEVIAEILINSGANINKSNYYDGYSPLHEACKQGRTDMVTTLLKYNAHNSNRHDRYFWTPLHVAQNAVIAKCLINSGIDVNALSTYGRTPLHDASLSGNTQVVKLLMKCNADPNTEDKWGYTPLHYACRDGYKDIVQCLMENGASVKVRTKPNLSINFHYPNATPIDILKYPSHSAEVSTKREKCLELIKQMHLKAEDLAPVIADLSTQISPTSPSIDKMDSYGLRVDVDPSSLSNGSPPVLVDIKVFTVDDEVSTPSFTFPEGTKPVSAVYTISLPDTQVPLCTLRIRHHVDPNNPEELSQLTFAKSFDDSCNKLKAIPGGKFYLGKQYGEITTRTSHVCSNWSIVGYIKKFFKKTRYVGTILYHTVRQYPNQWLMELMVAKHNPTSTLALNQYINSNCGYDVVKEREFILTFDDSDNPKLYLRTEEEELHVKCSNGWEILFELCEISQDTVDRFKRSTDVPGRCSLKIHTHKLVCHELAKLPVVAMKGISSDKKNIVINPPTPDAAAEFESDNTNVRPQLKNRGVVPTVKSVFDLMKRYSARWNEFGRELRISHNDRQILYDERISAEDRLERVIYKWIESECSPVTWDHLIDVLKIMGLKDVVDVIGDHTKQTSGSIPVARTNSLEEKGITPVGGSDVSKNNLITNKTMAMVVTAIVICALAMMIGWYS